MPNSCAVRCCHNTKRKTQEGIRFFRFPQEQEMRQRWVSLCDRDSDSGFNASNAVVCSIHFLPSDHQQQILYKHRLIGKELPRNLRTLRDDAVPSVNLCEESPVVASNMDDEQEPMVDVKVEIEEADDTPLTFGEGDPLSGGNDTSASWGEDDRETKINCVMLDVPWEEQISQHIHIQINEKNLRSTPPQDPLDVIQQPSTTNTENTVVKVSFGTGATQSRYVKSLPEKRQEEYFSKLKVGDSTHTLPDPYKVVGWMKNTRTWPDIHSGHIHQYLLCNQNPLTDINKTSASLYGYELFKSGSVLAIEYHPINTESSYCLLKAKVAKPPASCEAWVCLNKVEGSVQSSHCTCLISFQEVCSHIAALLFKVEAVMSLGLNKDYNSSSKYAIWNRCYRSKNHVTRVASIDFSAPNKPKKPRRLYKQLRPEPLSKSEQKEALNELKRILPNCVLFQENSDTDTASESEDESDHFIGPTPYIEVKEEAVEVPIKMEEDELEDF